MCQVGAGCAMESKKKEKKMQSPLSQSLLSAGKYRHAGSYNLVRYILRVSK